MRRRADSVDETRLRIVEATSFLHESVGPAHTTISGIAARAGVTRLTVYRHFPDDESLFSACSAHWTAQQRLPHPAAWASVFGPAERLRVGLTDLYRFYRSGEPMLRRIYGDWDYLPAPIQAELSQRDSAFRDLLLEPFAPSQRSTQLVAVLGHAVSFWTWRSLCLDNGLPDSTAVSAMTTLALALE
jgi:AcrR family transcriptional regulator